MNDKTSHTARPKVVYSEANQPELPPAPDLAQVNPMNMPLLKDGEGRAAIAHRQGGGRLEKAALRARRRQAMEMYLAGVSIEDIAAQLHFKDKYSLRKSLLSMLADSAPFDPEAMQEARDRERLLYMRMRQAFHMNAIRGESRAAEMVLKFSDRIRALDGLDAATKIDVQVSDKIDAEIEALIAQLPGQE